MTEQAMVPLSPAVRRWRVALVLTGLALLGLALVALVNEVPVTRWPGIALWLVGALIIHDGIVAMSVLAVSIAARRVGLLVPWGIVLIVQGALAVGAIVTALVVPEIVKKSIGTANPSILPLDYVANLGVFSAGLAGVAAIAVLLYMLRMPRRQSRRTT